MSRPTASATRNRLLIAAVGASLLAAAPAVKAGAQELPPPDTSTRAVGPLRPGDYLLLTVFRNEELSREYLIDAQGNVQIPGLAVIRVAGLTPDAVKQRIVEQMIELGFGSPDIAVQPIVRLSVLGEVRLPGQQKAEPGTTLLQLVTLAGGLTERADPARARVLRGGRAFPVNLEGALAGSPTGEVTLYSNDVLVVPRKGGLTRENMTLLLSIAGVALSVANVILSAR